MKKLAAGLLAAMVFVFAVQAQATEVTWQKSEARQGRHQGRAEFP